MPIFFDSPHSHRVLAALRRMSPGGRVRTTSALQRLAESLALTRLDVDEAVRDLYRAGLLEYQADSREMPVSGFIAVMKEVVSTPEHERAWARAMVAAGIDADTGAILHGLSAKLVDLSPQDMDHMYLATNPSTRIDEESIDNEFPFRHRFGFDANLTGRAQVIALKTQFQMTDVEFCSLRRSGQISIKRTEVRIAPDRLVPMVGWLYLLIISLTLLPSLLAIAFGPASGWKQDLGFMTLGAIWLAATWFVCKLHINPWRLLKQVGALPVTKE